MNVADIIRACAEDGVQLYLTDAQTVKASGDQAWIAEWLPILREHKAEIITELHRQRRHAKVLSMLGDTRRYAVLIENDKTDPVVCTVAIRGLATFDMEIPKHSYNGTVLLELIEKQSVEALQSLGNTITSPPSNKPSQAQPRRREA
jgi:hypothetical protein